MPQPNKSQSPPHLRSLSSQGSITGLPSDYTPMRYQSFFFSNVSARRIGSSQRARPVATSIADIFVRSLVVAGYCHKHSPRSRAISTTSAKASRGLTGDWEDRGLGRSRRRTLAKHPPGFMTQIENLGVRRSKTQRIFSSTVAQRVEIYDSQDHRIHQTSTRHSSRSTPVNYARPSNTACTENASRPLQREGTNSGRSHGSIVPHEDWERVKSRGPAHEVAHKQETSWLTDREKSYKSSAKELYEQTSEIYQELLGDQAWREAADAAAAFEHFPAQFDDTKSSDDLNSVRKLEEHLGDKTKANHYIFTLYRELPSPGVRHLSKRSRGLLLRRFADPPGRRWVDARRYLALVEDMLAAGLPLSRSLWSSAIHLAGRSTGKVTKFDLVRAVGIWNQMEHLAGIRSDSVVFTILFDIAAKAGQFTVAERLIKEMERRQIKFGRAGKVTNIFYNGLLGDVDGVCRAFDEFVESGEIVDTAVMNCLMTSFLKAGETESAMQIYQQLLQNQPTTNLARQNLTSELIAYRKSSKKLGRVLQASASLKGRLPQHHQALQEALVVGPDTRTFHILLSHHAYKSGDLGAFESVLEDMEKVFPVPPRGMIYLLLFEGFARHGRHKRGWTAEKLRMAWRAYLRALYESKTRIQHRSFALPPSFVWENPLRDDGATAPPVLVDSSIELYTPLPIAPSSTRGPASKPPAQDEHQSSVQEDLIDILDQDPLDLDVHIDIPTDLTQERPREGDTLGLLEHRLENGVFLGRRMILIILRAFGACCGPDDIMEAWLRMESIWQPEKRRGTDVIAVKEELELQLNRARRRVGPGLK
ncbi:hypothetical protein AN4433.2 [Aspergillus nidulans FGSC A4]|uniref:Pentatricopeptide repeat protein (AFU_orthologue AFUA_4G07240) n=1 Tax=Emericella nidulans (strain FGSC A4 / ATCC 38163 / CBS 112.46 / NRRL 194 / M139) TaxID=227321 RepID=Q5B4U7_EMENI|nr:hypothetical protein [Aspergillus nidulans FGSC A4]EAA60198.1 hypothetical protein AN4433.2 [Aspergillus nidulans FGSC A4]CBF77534.1 TPA: pentatricopeptide repeat protein (AFU_orthologue; AFUA_4G07240) [Aspergillus nidulans FGSC A4]|eukprot:XP_662037.1 hypothetical protein AN4433.2 [Aspergillus nidulans FGSC A4]